MDLVRRAKEIASILSALTNITQSGGGSGSSGGGSGSGDLSTATIKFINSGDLGTSYAVTVAEIIDESGTSGIFFGEETVYGERTVVVPLYKGKHHLDPMLEIANVDYDVTPTFTGGAEFSLDGIVITGDCTITFAGMSSGGGGGGTVIN